MGWSKPSVGQMLYNLALAIVQRGQPPCSVSTLYVYSHAMLTNYSTVGDVEYGRGSGLTQGDAKELAAEQALRALWSSRGHY